MDKYDVYIYVYIHVDADIDTNIDMNDKISERSPPHLSLPAPCSHSARGHVDGILKPEKIEGQEDCIWA